MLTEEPYAAIFNSYIAAGASASLARVQDPDRALSEPDRQQAWHTLSYALGLDSAWPAARDLLLALAPKMAHAGYRQEWLPYLEQGLKQSQAQSDGRAEAETALYLGHLHQRLGRLAIADKYVSEAARLFEEQGSLVRQSAALNRQAEIARGRRDFDAARCLTDMALALLATDPGADCNEEGHSYLIKGRIAFNQSLWTLAGRHFSAAMQLYEEADLPHRLAVCIQNLGRVHMMEPDYDSAIVDFEQAIELLYTTNDIFNLAVAQMNLGIAHSLCGRPYEALRQYAKAEPVFRRLQDRAHLAKVLNNQGMEMNNLKRWTDAKQLLHASSELSLQLGDMQEYLNAQDSLGLAYLGAGDCAKAVEVYEQALALSEEHAQQRFSRQMLADLSEHLQRATEACEAHT